MAACSLACQNSVCLMPQKHYIKMCLKASRKFEFIQATALARVPNHLCDAANCRIAFMKSVSTKQQTTFCPPKCYFGVWELLGWSSSDCHWHWHWVDITEHASKGQLLLHRSQHSSAGVVDNSWYNISEQSKINLICMQTKTLPVTWFALCLRKVDPGFESQTPLLNLCCTTSRIAGMRQYT